MMAQLSIELAVEEEVRTLFTKTEIITSKLFLRRHLKLILSSIKTIIDI